MSRAHWLPVAAFLSAAGVTAACSLEAGSNETSGGGSFSVGAGGGGAKDTGGNGQGGSGNGKNIVEPSTDNDVGTGGASPTSSNTPTIPGAGGGDGDGGGGGGSTITPEICKDPGSPRVFYLSSDDSNSMGSPALAREHLSAGLAPPPAFIRPYEFLNYYRIRYDPVTLDDGLGVHVSYAKSPADGVYHLQVGVQAFPVQRPKVSLTFVVDTSSSLIGEGVARERAAIKAIASKLVQGDRVSFVVWANEDAVLLEKHEVSGPDDPALIAAADGLSLGGGSDLHAGLTHGYALATDPTDKDRLSRVVLISDGGANLGVVDRTVIEEAAKKGDDQGIYLVGIGVGPAQGYSDALMNAVTDAGRGAYVYLDSPDEATAALAERFDEVMDIAARGVEVELTLPSYFGIASTSAEQISSDKDAVTPQHLAPGDSMTFFQTLGAVKESIICANDMVAVKVTWTAPALHPSSGKTFSFWEEPIKSLEGETWQMRKAAAIVAYANALRSQTQGDFDAAVEAVTSAKDDPEILANDAHSAELSDIADLLASFPTSALKP